MSLSVKREGGGYSEILLRTLLSRRLKKYEVQKVEELGLEPRLSEKRPECGSLVIPLDHTPDTCKGKQI